EAEADQPAHGDEGHEFRHDHAQHRQRPPGGEGPGWPHSRPRLTRRSPAWRSARLRAWTPQRVTRHSASRTMLELILLAPRWRSVNVIGTSTTRRPSRWARQARSTWKQYPWDATESMSILSSTGIR